MFADATSPCRESSIQSLVQVIEVEVALKLVPFAKDDRDLHGPATQMPVGI
jgi:hypothetical protein